MIKLIIPNKQYLESYKEAYNENINNNVKQNLFTNPDENILTKFDNYRKGINLKPGYVSADYYWLVDDETNEFIGEISIRHSLNDYLLRYGGHIGYAVRPSKWNKGYATIMLKYALVKAKDIGIDKVLITCNDNNIGSIRVIEKNGGILENKIQNIINNEEITTRRYWINLL